MAYAVSCGNFLQLQAVIKSKNNEFFPVTGTGADSVQMFESRVFAQTARGGTVQQKKSVSQRVRDIKRVIAKVKENDAPVKVEKIEELKQLNKVRRDSRKIKFVDQKYKQVKFYGSLC